MSGASAGSEAGGGGAARYKELHEELARHAVDLRDELCGGEDKQLWIAVAGAPGSGKSTLCAKVAEKIQEMGIECKVLPMDGFHFYRRELDAMANSEEAHARRGAHWTFNATRMVAELQSARKTGARRMPSFDHAVGDPVEGDIEVCESDQIVIVEGNYLLLYGESPWGELEGLFDERWFVSCEEGVLRDRVVTRNSAAWGWDRKRTEERFDANDLLNARLIASTAVHADRVIDHSN